MKHIFSFWLVLVITISCVLGVVYVALQQNIRMGANDPQIQVAEDLKTILGDEKYHQLLQQLLFQKK